MVYRNKEDQKAYDKQYYIKNREKRLLQCSNWLKNNKELKREYYNKNKNRININANIRELNRRKTDMNFRLRKNLRSRIRMAVKHNIKIDKKIDFLGCDIYTLRQHLESNFKDNMSWDNYGDWHIDHIKPCNKFDLTKEDERKKCFNYTNLQPLWAKDNYSKGAKYEF